MDDDEPERDDAERDDVDPGGGAAAAARTVVEADLLALPPLRPELGRVDSASRASIAFSRASMSAIAFSRAPPQYPRKKDSGAALQSP